MDHVRADIFRPTGSNKNKINGPKHLRTGLPTFIVDNLSIARIIVTVFSVTNTVAPGISVQLNNKSAMTSYVMAARYGSSVAVVAILKKIYF